MQHTTLTFSKEGLTETINDAHHALLKNALAQKIITEEQHSEMIKYVVVVAEKGFFGKLYDRLFDDKGGIFYRVVKNNGCIVLANYQKYLTNKII